MNLDNSGRQRSIATRLAKAGLQAPDVAVSQLEKCVPLLEHEEFIDELSLAADPDVALDSTLAWFANADARLQSRLLDEAGLRARWIEIAGTSLALAQFCIKHPAEILTISDNGLWQERATRQDMVQRLLDSVNAKWSDGRWVAEADNDHTLDALRIAYRRELLAIAARDVCALEPLERVSLGLSNLADAVIETALAIAWSSVNPETPRCKIAVIAMGKCGGRELNYISDVDVIFVAEPFEDATGFNEEATRLASRLMQVCEVPTGEGSIWQVDAALRPEGKAGALVRSLDGHKSYYERWAQTWEFQALLKAREMAGDAELGRTYVDAMLPYVWEAAQRPNFVADVQAMRQRVVENIPAKELEREIKLGIGGLRDVEFAVQLLQLVHGRSDVMLRSSNTLEALEALANWGYVGREDAASLATVYRFERTLEHRIQMHLMRRTHLLPEEDADLRRLGKSMGFRNDPADELMSQWRKKKHHARRLHEKLFYRPLLQAVVRLDASDARLSLDAAHDRLKALGFLDPESALRHLAALSTGVSRRAAIQRTLLPVMLDWMSQTPKPDAGLLAFRRVSDALGATPWYLRLLRDDSAVAERMAQLLCISPYVTDMLMRAPEAVNLLASEESLHPKSAESLSSEMASVAGRSESAADAVNAIRSIRQRELIRIACADLLDVIDVQQVGAALSDLADATLQISLEAVLENFWTDREKSLEIALIGLGRLGGRELNYRSDADVCFVYAPINEHPKAGSDAVMIISQLQQLLAQPGNDPSFELDMDLRPEGRQGAVVRTLDSYAAYYQRWSLTWESQALLRARAIAGDPTLGDQFISMIDALRYPEGGLSAEQLRDIRRIKARVESERLPRGVDPALHVKLGPGGISDVEWTVQLLQLQHAQEITSLQTTETLSGLKAAEQAGLISDEDREILTAAWLEASDIRNVMTLSHSGTGDSIPTQPEVARLVGYIHGRVSAAVLVENYRRLTRRARAVMERHVYGTVIEEQYP
ncbi:MAG: hypothetical protein RIS75_539 [Actinomycetota bacterium]